MNWWVLGRKIHISWLICVYCLGILVGIFGARYVDPVSFSSYTWLIISLVVAVIIFLRRYLYLLPVLIVGGIILGLWRGSAQEASLNRIQPFFGVMSEVAGRVREDADTNSSNKLVLRIDNLTVNSHLMVGTFWVTTNNDKDIKRSDEVTLEGKISPGFGSFSGTMYTANVTKIQRPEPGDIAREVRDWFAGAIRTAIPDPEASLGIGYLVGQKRALPTDLVEALQIAGLTHIVVASGYNLTILVRLARRLFEKISKYLSALSASLMIFCFVTVTGLSPSMTRAGLVAGLSLLAWYYGRRFHPIVLLVFAATVTVMINPSYAWGDLGWQLSFAAFAGVMILAPLLQRYFFGDKKPGIVRQVVGETVSATILTAPVLIGAFGQISNVSIVANMLVLPLVPLAMLLTFISGVGALIIPGLAAIIGLPATWLLQYMVGVANYLSKLPFAVTKVQLPGLGILACYLIILAVVIYLWRKTKFNFRDSNIVE